MKITTFTIPIFDSDQAVDECNALLSTVKVLRLDKQFVDKGEFSCWSILVEYIEAKKSGQKSFGKDYKQVLSAADFQLYLELRKKRKEFAEEHGVPLSSVFTNEQLARIAQDKIKSTDALRQLDGVGEKKVEKYSTILDLVPEQGS